MDGTGSPGAAVLGLEAGDGLPAPGGCVLLGPCSGFGSREARRHRLDGRRPIREEIGRELEGGHRGKVSDHDSKRRPDLRLRVTWQGRGSGLRPGPGTG